MQATLKKVHESYPNIQGRITIAEYYDGSKWVASNFEATEQTLLRLYKQGVDVINLRFEDEFGAIRRPDFTMKELILRDA